MFRFRKEASIQLVRQMLELPLYRMAPLSDEFIDLMADIVIARIEMDLQKQHTEAIRQSLEKDGS